MNDAPLAVSVSVVAPTRVPARATTPSPRRAAPIATRAAASPRRRTACLAGVLAAAIVFAAGGGCTASPTSGHTAAAVADATAATATPPVAEPAAEPAAAANGTATASASATATTTTTTTNTTPDAGPPVAAAIEFDLAPSGDYELDQLRLIAVKAPLDELFAKAMFLLVDRVSTYPRDAALWHGVDRLTAEIVANPSRPVDESIVAVLVGQIEGTARPDAPSLRERVPALRARRAEVRRQREALQQSGEPRR